MVGFLDGFSRQSDPYRFFWGPQSLFEHPSGGGEGDPTQHRRESELILVLQSRVQAWTSHSGSRFRVQGFRV